MGHIEGIGRAKLGRYGATIVAIVLLPVMLSPTRPVAWLTAGKLDRVRGAGRWVAGQSLMTAMRTLVMATNVPIIQRK